MVNLDKQRNADMVILMLIFSRRLSTRRALNRNSFYRQFIVSTKWLELGLTFRCEHVHAEMVDYPEDMFKHRPLPLSM